jgi:hypothetical protein
MNGFFSSLLKGDGVQRNPESHPGFHPGYGLADFESGGRLVMVEMLIGAGRV